MPVLGVKPKRLCFPAHAAELSCYPSGYGEPYDGYMMFPWLTTVIAEH